MDVHVTNPPIDQELRRRHLAQRLVAHGARTKTIYRHTALSRHQLRTLRQRWRIPNEIRHRGEAPTSFAGLQSPLRTREEAAALAVFWSVLAGIGGGNDRTHKMSPLEVGERVCDVFDAYLACFPKSTLHIEHLFLLVRGLDEADEIAVSTCGKCEAVILIDLLAARRRCCSHCQRKYSIASVVSDPRGNTTPGSSPAGTDEPVQQELF